MYNYSMMYPMMASSMMMYPMMGYGNSCSGNVYANMRSRYGYPDSIIDVPPPPMSSVQRDPRIVPQKRTLRTLFKKFFNV